MIERREAKRTKDDTMKHENNHRHQMPPLPESEHNPKWEKKQ
jgi:hypothetical protein